MTKPMSEIRDELAKEVLFFWHEKGHKWHALKLADEFKTGFNAGVIEARKEIIQWRRDEFKHAKNENEINIALDALEERFK